MKIEIQPYWGLEQSINIIEKLKFSGRRYKEIQIALVGGPKKYPVPPPQFENGITQTIKLSCAKLICHRAILIVPHGIKYMIMLTK